jgi:hypothetical protein
MLSSRGAPLDRTQWPDFTPSNGVNRNSTHPVQNAVRKHKHEHEHKHKPSPVPTIFLGELFPDPLVAGEFLGRRGELSTMVRGLQRCVTSSM